MERRFELPAEHSIDCPAAPEQDVLSIMRAFVRPGDTVYTVSHGRGWTGSYPKMALFVIQRGHPIRLTQATAVALGLKTISKHWRGYEAVVVSQECGKDMGRELVRHLGRALWPEGAQVNETYQPDGGDVLHHCWL